MGETVPAQHSTAVHGGKSRLACSFHGAGRGINPEKRTLSHHSAQENLGQAGTTGEDS